MAVKNIASAAAFNSEILASAKLSACVFTADWCPWCRSLAPKIDHIAPQLEDIDIFMLDVDQAVEIKEQYAVRTIPTLILFKDGRPLAQEMVSRFSENDLLTFIKGHGQDSA